MARRQLRLLCLALAVALCGAVTCPAQNTSDISCYCSTGCATAGGPGWNAPVSPPVSLDQGPNTICVTVSGVCSGATASLYNSNSGGSCTPGTNWTFFTSFNQAECTMAVNSGLGSIPGEGVYFCTGSNCNTPSTASMVVFAPAASPSGAARVASRGLLAAVALAAALL